MNSILRNTLAVVAGILIGGFVNMQIITISGSVIPLPEGVNPADVESLKENIHLFEPRHFLFPFLAHALGTLVGAFLAGLLAATHRMKFAISIGFFFLIGGIASIVMLTSPLWFTVVDLVGAYLPMGWLGGRLSGVVRKE